MPMNIEMGELFVWTGVDREFEEDFNLWYDREHMAERVQIPGFLWARRYRSRDSNRPYLALYRTESKQIFKTSDYLQAFNKQTEWSLTNFSRMRNTHRRVMIVTPVTGVGTGGALALIQLDDEEMAQRAATLSYSMQKNINGILSLRILNPDRDLSTPLPSEDLESRTLNPFLAIDATTEQSAVSSIEWFADRLHIDVGRGSVFQLLWELRTDEIGAQPGN